MIYGYADVGRFGLAHSMLAWARCLVWCKTNNIPMLAPNWFRIRIGPYVRREYDKREYFRFFKYDEEISGIKKLFILIFSKKILDQEADHPEKFIKRNGLNTIIFKNSLISTEKYFYQIIDHHELVKKYLLKSIKTKYLPVIDDGQWIGIHVRRGDFNKSVSLDQIQRGAFNVRLPIEWYIDILLGIRAKLGYAIPAKIFSDGTDDELYNLLRLPSVRRSRKQDAITDMLELSHAKAIIASGSGFSFWACYLSQVPRICFPGQRQIKTICNDPENHLEPECENADDIPIHFIEYLSQTNIF